jgi:hypothetical protein
MANVRKRISELNALNSASLDTVIVGVDNGTTYKIELDVLADAVTNRVNTLDRDRLQSLESVTSSFETKGRSVVSGSSQLTSSFDTRYVVSGSITQTTWDNIANKPAGIVSQSTDLSSLNTFTASISTASLVISISNLNTFTASQSTSSLVDRLNTIESISGSWITESETGSFLTSLSGAISSSSQLTSSYDARYTLSGSISATPSGTISGSSQLTSSFDTRYSLSGSSVNINTSSFATTGSNSFNGNQNITGSLVVSAVAVVAGALTIPSASVISLTSGSSISVDASGAITGSLTGSVFGIGDVVAFSASLNSRIISGSVVAGTISGSSQLTSSFDTRYAISASFVSSSNLSSIQTITSASYAALTPVSGTLYIIIG